MSIAEGALFRAYGLDYPGPSFQPDEEVAIFDHPIFNRIVRHDGHWLWQGAQGAGGPEWRPAGGAHVLVHRWLWERCEGEPLQPDQIVRNACGRLRCVFPGHHVVETRSTRMREIRGRETPPAAVVAVATAHIDVHNND